MEADMNSRKISLKNEDPKGVGGTAGGNDGNRCRRDRLQFFTIQEVADSLGVCDRTVGRWIARGELIAHWFGRSIRIEDDDLRLFLARRRGA